MSIKRFYRKSGDVSGQPPESMAVAGVAPRERTPSVSVFQYNRESCEYREISRLADCLPLKNHDTVSWINIDGIGCVELLKEIEDHFKLHPLTVEDIFNNTQRPKVEEFENYIFAVMKMLSYDVKAEQVESEQLSIVLAGNCIITFQEKAGGDVFDGIRERLKSSAGKIRRLGADYLFYCLIDAVLDNYFTVLEHVGDSIDFLEGMILKGASRTTPRSIDKLKRELLFIRKAAWPLRDMSAALGRSELEIFGAETRLGFRDFHDHSVQVVDTVEIFRDMSSGMMDMYLSNLSLRLNEIMKFLTVISTIFIPLTFLAGVYGMNFENMPELKWKYGYFMILGVFVLSAGGLAIFFRRKKWM